MNQNPFNHPQAELHSIPEKKSESICGTWRDAEGNIVCDYEIELEAKKVHKNIHGEMLRVQQCKSFKIISPTSEKSIDIIQQFNPTHVPIFLCEDLDDIAGGFDRIDKFIVVAKREHQSIAKTILHELRHVQQPSEKRFSNIDDMYGAETLFTKKQRVWDMNTYQALLIRLEILQLIIPPLEEIVLTDFVHFVDEQVLLIEEISADFTIPRDEVEQKCIAIQQDILQFKLLRDITVHDALSYPKWLLERDAEYGALMSMREIKKEIGVNLFASFGGMELPKDIVDAFTDPEKFNILPRDLKDQLQKLIIKCAPITMSKLVDAHMKKIDATPKNIRKFRTPKK